MRFFSSRYTARPVSQIVNRLIEVVDSLKIFANGRRPNSSAKVSSGRAASMVIKNSRSEIMDNNHYAGDGTESITMTKDVVLVAQ